MIHEVYVFLSALGSGLAAGFIYDLFRLKRKVLKTKVFMLTLEDIAFWLITAVIIFLTAFISNEGEVRLFFLMAAAFGVTLYFLLLSRWVILIITFLVKIIIWPFVLLVKLFKPQFIRLYELIRKGAVKSKEKLHREKIRIDRRLRSVRHIMRKV